MSTADHDTSGPSNERTPIITFRIRKTPFEREYAVRVYFDGIYQEGPTAYESTRRDAVATMGVMREWYAARGMIVSSAGAEGSDQ